MKNTMQPYRRQTREAEEDPEDRHFTYGRPSAPAWIAAAAVAFAFFLLGGFIKTYRQLDALRDESRQEIAELREAVRRLQAQSTSTAPVRPSAPLSQLETLPSPPFRNDRPARSARVERSRDTRQAYRPDPRFPSTEPLNPIPANRALPGVRPANSPPPASAGDLALQNLPAGIGFAPDGEDLRRMSPPARNGNAPTDDLAHSPAGGGYRVVSISNAQKRVMVEGGRDLGLGEGARLELIRDGRWIADLRVVDVFANQSSCEVLQASLNPEPGDTIRRPARDR